MQKILLHRSSGAMSWLWFLASWVFLETPIYAAGLNDTGIKTCSNATQNSLTCPVTVQLSTANIAVTDGRNVPITVTIANQSSDPINLLKWALPITANDGVMLHVTRNGKPVTYLGAIYKRRAPTEADYITLVLGQKISQSIELNQLFDLSEGGTYTIEYDFYSGHRIAYDKTATQAFSSVVNTPSGIDNLKSEPVQLTLAPALRELLQQNEPDANSLIVKIATYTGCTATQQTQLATALTTATDYATISFVHLAEHPRGSAYSTKWFGAYDARRKQIVYTHFNNEKNAFLNQTIAFQCGCTDSAYAYVYPNQPYKIYLCSAFWTAPNRSTNSKAGTLIHEMSHFAVIASTQDYVYGQTAAAALAISNPANAIMNADNHEYFAEGLDTNFTVTPSAGIGGSVMPNTPQVVSGGATTDFTVTANTGYTRSNAVTGTCPQLSWGGIVWTANVWTTGTITANCTVNFSFTVSIGTATTLAASDITATSAKLNGQVTSNWITVAASFDFGISTSYGTNIAAIPAQINSATPVNVSAIKTGLSCGTTYHYRVVETNGIGTTNGVDKTFTTSVCPSVAPTVTTTAATGITVNSAKLNGTVDPNDSGVTAVKFDFGTTTSYGTSINAMPSTIAATAAATSVSADKTGLICGTTYHYRVIATNGFGTTNGTDKTFSTLACPATVTTTAATGITVNSAKLNGTVDPNDSRVTAVKFDFGTTTSYGTSINAIPSTIAATAAVTNVSADKTGLICGTTYHYRVNATNGVGTTNGTDKTFTTLACPATIPTVTTTAATEITATSAKLNGTVSPNGAQTTFAFELGLTTAYGTNSGTNTIEASTNAFNVSGTMTGLTCNKLYHYRLKATNSKGTTLGSDKTFTTLACPTATAPTVTTTAATEITKTGAKLNGTVKPNGAETTYIFELGLTTAYGSNSSTGNLAANTNTYAVSGTWASLTCNKLYHYRLKATNSKGTTLGSDKTFTTLACTP